MFAAIGTTGNVTNRRADTSINATGLHVRIHWRVIAAVIALVDSHLNSDLRRLPAVTVPLPLSANEKTRVTEWKFLAHPQSRRSTARLPLLSPVKIVLISLQ